MEHSAENRTSTKWNIVVWRRNRFGERWEPIQSIECFTDPATAYARTVELLQEDHDLTVSIRRTRPNRAHATSVSNATAHRRPRRRTL